ncbi:Po1 beta superfamily nucleotidyltransferase [Cryptosporidium sp. chipmunk genotype I]|uniref:Po1 beta superfamily nucleotidyltransferase n=1 Tax=Cryptosporidium sp. chipmunk genotype I TaxID=1280935 RepID=UPI00351A4F00|nr:Po1 beta superfamily nucleotidyltransferase [Cryptosporidium sp. chipmunk genotype I]
MTTTGKRSAETDQRRRSVLVSVERVIDPTSEKKDVSGKSGRRPAHSNKKINLNSAKSTQTDSNNKGSSGITEISSGQFPNKLTQPSLCPNNAQHRKKKSEKLNCGEVRCTSNSINNVASNLPSLSTLCSPTSASAVTSTQKSTSIPASDCSKTSKASANNNNKSRTSLICENITSHVNIGTNGSSDSNQQTKGGFLQGIVQNNAVSECQQYGQLHVPLITPISHQFWYNQLMPQGNFGHIIPPPPDYFHNTKSSSNIQKQDLILPGSTSSTHAQLSISSNASIGNNLGGCTPAIFNYQIPYFQPYSLRSYEISTLNVINYLIPNKEFRLKVSSVVNDLRNWLEQSKIPLLVFPYGSTSTGFADQFSDVDIALIPKKDLSDKVKYGDAPISDIFTKPPGLILQELLSLLQSDSLDTLDVLSKNKSAGSSDFMNSLKNENKMKGRSAASLNRSDEAQKLRNPFTCIQDITSAHIPIIRMLHTYTDIVLDISIALPSTNNQEKFEKDEQTSGSLHKILPIQKANSLPIIQSRLGILTWYARMDPRVVHVVVLTKVWTRFRGLRNTLNGFPGGYAWTICVIYFFQKIGILPVIDANEFFIKSHNASNILFKDILEDLNSDNAQSRNKSSGNNLTLSSIKGSYKKGKKDIYFQNGIEKIEGIPEESYVDGNFPSLVSDLDQEETVNYKYDIEDVSNGNYDTETASGSADIAEQVISSDSSFDSEPDKGSIEKDGAGCKMLYLDVVKGSKFQYKSNLEVRGGRNAKPSANNRYSISEDINSEGALLNVRNLNLDKPLEEHETFNESSRSSIGSTACTYSLSPGILSSDNICINCSDPKYSCVCSESNTVTVTSVGYPIDGICCRNNIKQLDSNGDKEDDSCSLANMKGYSKQSNREVISEKEKNEEPNSTSSVREIFDIDELFSDPPTLINNVKVFEESKFLKFSQSHTLFYRFLKFIETHLWTTVIDISSPDIINTTIPGICCDIRNPFPGPPACRPIFDENNKKHLRNEIQRAIQIIQSPFGDYSSICGGYLNVTAEHSKGFLGGAAGIGNSLLGVGLGLPLSPSNVNTTKQRISPHQHFGAFESPPLHIVGYNPVISGVDQNNGNFIFPSQVPVTNLYSDPPQHLIFPSISAPVLIPPPPPPPPPPKIKHSSSVLEVIRGSSFESIKNAN